jgi:hypothetical protein
MPMAFVFMNVDAGGEETVLKELQGIQGGVLRLRNIRKGRSKNKIPEQGQGRRISYIFCEDMTSLSSTPVAAPLIIRTRNKA